MTYGQEAVLDVARTMISKGYDPCEVKTLTGISQEEIKEAKPAKKMKKKS